MAELVLKWRECDADLIKLLRIGKIVISHNYYCVYM